MRSSIMGNDFKENFVLVIRNSNEFTYSFFYSDLAASEKLYQRIINFLLLLVNINIEYNGTSEKWHLLCPGYDLHSYFR